ncbi:MAG: hypothetical protein WD824_20315 [Cyclobacteriaceae bacterium]
MKMALYKTGWCLVCLAVIGLNDVAAQYNKDFRLRKNRFVPSVLNTQPLIISKATRHSSTMYNSFLLQSFTAKKPLLDLYYTAINYEDNYALLNKPSMSSIEAAFKYYNVNQTRYVDYSGFVYLGYALISGRQFLVGPQDQEVRYLPQRSLP